MVRTWHFHCWGPGSIPGRELRSRKPVWQKKKKGRKERVMKKRRKTRRKENMKEYKNRTQAKKRKDKQF